MSHPSVSGNGCSLEDCHTNLFALTDLCGIKWRKLSTGTNSYSSDPLEDPVLSSFAKCIQSDILCVWRRTPRETHHKGHEPLTACSKELWLFWYGDKPTNIDNLLSKDLRELEQGSWDNGLSYECRTLLFRALHNLIEKCLLSKRFIRIGKWFVQPYENGGKAGADRSSHLSISFSFFLHGESTVCASLDVRHHPPVWKLSPQHLRLAGNNNPGTQTAGLSVILAPYGLSGSLTGASFKNGDDGTLKFLSDWNRFYPVCTGQGTGQATDGDDANALPNVVEITIGGAKMRYPSQYVLVTEPTAEASGSTSSRVAGGTVSFQPERAQTGVASIGTVPTGKTNTFESEGNLQQRVLERVWQDSNRVKEKVVKRTEGSGNDESSCVNAGSWEHFTDPTHREMCGCTKCKAVRGRTTSGQVKGSSKHKVEKLERQMSKHGSKPVLFHRRSPVNEDILQSEMDVVSSRVSAGQYTQYAGGPDATSNQSHVRQNMQAEFDPVASESPRSVVASAQVGSHQANVSQGQPPMLTPSPHPPLTNGKDKNDDESTAASAAVNHGEPQEIKTNVTPSESSSVTKTNINTYSNSNGQVTLQNVYHRVYPNSVQNGNGLFETQKKRTDVKGLKRPVLPTSTHGDPEVIVTEALYNFDTLNSWLNHPVKRFKNAVSKNPDVKYPQQFLDSHAATSPHPSRSTQPSPTTAASTTDPYDFADEEPPPQVGPVKLGRRRSFRPSRDGSQSKLSVSRRDEDSQDSRRSSDSKLGNEGDEDLPTTPGLGSTSLMREIDIVPKASDLDHIFGSDDDNDDAFHDPSPSGMRAPDDITKSITKAAVNGVEIIGPAELLRMFPTPPSPPTHSPPPSNTECSGEIAAAIEATHVKTERFTRHQVQHQTVVDKHKECSAVFEPINLEPVASSSKFSPVELPSSKLSPLHVPELYMYKPTFHYHSSLVIIGKRQAPVSQMTAMQSVDHSMQVSSNKMVPPVGSNNDRMMTGSSDRTISVEASPAMFSSSMSPAAAYPARSPAAFPGHSPAAFQGTSPYAGGGQQRTPISFDLQSPASNASSYMNRNLSSIDNQGTNTQLPEISSLLVNIILSDSLLNMFKDHNFDSCNICVCNMNIKGADMGVYLMDTSSQPEVQEKCRCGFSAVINRRLGYNAGLFYEDEVDITGIRDDKYERKKPSLLAVEQKPYSPAVDSVPHDIVRLLQVLFASPFYSFTATRLHFNSEMFANSGYDFIENQDGCSACYSALEQGRQAAENVAMVKLEDVSSRATLLHKWPQQTVGAVLTSSDKIHTLKMLQPLLQDALHKKLDQRLWERPYRISGPMTWKDFHLMAGRGSDEASEPQPIPSVLVGHDKEWSSLCPHNLLFWDKMLLEPYSKPRDVVYVVVSPDNDALIPQVKTYFKELSTVYELLRLGRHAPLDQSLRDGILRVGKQLATKLSGEAVDDWFEKIGKSPVAAKLKLIALACKCYLAPFLSKANIDESLFDTSVREKPGGRQPQSAPSPAPPPTPEQTIGTPRTPQNPDGDRDDTEGPPRHRDFSLDRDEERTEGPGLIIYIIDPFTFGSDWPEMKRLAMLGLLRCYQELKTYLPERLKDNVYLQIVPMESVVDRMDVTSRYHHFKSMSFNVFTQCKRHLRRSIIGRSLTGFGPAASAEEYVRTKPGGLLGNPQFNQIFNPPYILSLQKDTQSALAESCGDTRERSDIMLCGYCLSEDQRWLLAVCTDDSGEMLETCTINIEIPNRNRRKKVSARKIGLQKLLDFIIGVISMTSSPWRLVIGRLGRLGHGELKGWSSLLSRKSLLRMSKQLKDTCNQCNIVPNNEMPCILSACLVSLEPQNTFQIMPDSVKPEDRRASNLNINTPIDASVTHILVFPTSTTAQANTQAFQYPNQMGIDDNFGTIDDVDLFTGLQEEDLNIGQDLEQLLGFDGPESPKDGHLSMPGSPNHISNGSLLAANGMSKGNLSMSAATDIQEDPPNLLQQPLAMGYYISTASSGPLPKWFWSSCHQKMNSIPAHFKSALHVHCPTIQQNQDDLFHHAQKHSHPLDSSFTCDVLRYVLETYNALSWLTFDTSTGKRRSCLPVHFMVLMQIYHAMNTYI